MKNHMIKVGTAVPSLKIADVPYNTEKIISSIRVQISSDRIYC